VYTVFRLQSKFGCGNESPNTRRGALAQGNGRLAERAASRTVSVGEMLLSKPSETRPRRAGAAVMEARSHLAWRQGA